MSNHKVCPILIRHFDTPHILAFEHPLAGFQLVKGGIEMGEAPQSAAIREMREESGLDVQHPIFIETITFETPEKWELFFVSASSNVPSEWTFFTQDGGGLLFRFFWFDLTEKPCSNWHPKFKAILAKIATIAVKIK